MRPKPTAIDYSLTLLRRRDYSKRELRERLQRKGFSPREVKESLSRLCQWGYVDDHKVACGLIERFIKEERSREYTRRRLERAGIEPETLLLELDRLYPAEKEREILFSRWRQICDKNGAAPLTVKEKMKWAGRMSRMGFPATELEALLNRE